MPRQLLNTYRRSLLGNKHRTARVHLDSDAKTIVVSMVDEDDKRVTLADYETDDRFDAQCVALEWLFPLSPSQASAVQSWAEAHGSISWRNELAHAWQTGNYGRGTDYSGHLQTLRNNYGPEWLRQVPELFYTHRVVTSPSEFRYCLLPASNAAEFEELEMECKARSVRLQWCESNDGSRIFRVPVTDLPRLPKDEKGPYLGDDSSGHAVHPISATALMSHRKAHGYGEWRSH